MNTSFRPSIPRNYLVRTIKNQKFSGIAERLIINDEKTQPSIGSKLLVSGDGTTSWGELPEGLIQGKLFTKVPPHTFSVVEQERETPVAFFETLRYYKSGISDISGDLNKNLIGTFTPSLVNIQGETVSGLSGTGTNAIDGTVDLFPEFTIAFWLFPTTTLFLNSSASVLLENQDNSFELTCTITNATTGSQRVRIQVLIDGQGLSNVESLPLLDDLELINPALVYITFSYIRKEFRVLFGNINELYFVDNIAFDIFSFKPGQLTLTTNEINVAKLCIFKGFIESYTTLILPPPSSGQNKCCYSPQRDQYIIGGYQTYPGRQNDIVYDFSNNVFSGRAVFWVDFISKYISLASVFVALYDINVLQYPTLYNVGIDVYYMAWNSVQQIMVVVGNGNTAWSNNGSSWTLTNDANASGHLWRSVVYSKERNVFVAVGPTQKFIYSYDGKSWKNGTFATTPPSPIQSVAWSPLYDEFVFCSSGEYVMSGSQLGTFAPTNVLGSMNISKITWSTELNVYFILLEGLLFYCHKDEGVHTMFQIDAGISNIKDFVYAPKRHEIMIWNGFAAYALKLSSYSYTTNGTNRGEELLLFSSPDTLGTKISMVNDPQEYVLPRNSTTRYYWDTTISTSNKWAPFDKTNAL